MDLFYEIRNAEKPFFLGDAYIGVYPAHIHEVIEILILISGRGRLMMDGQIYTMESGDIAIAFPYTPHSYESFDNGSKGLAVFCMPNLFQEFCVTFSETRPIQPVLQVKQQPKELLEIIQKLTYLSVHPTSRLRPAYLHLFLAYLLTSLEMRPAMKQRSHKLLDQVLSHVSQHCCENITLASIAGALNISVSYLSHMFSRQLSVPFRKYVNTLRINRAKVLMRDPGLSLTDISGRCGYETQRTFNRAFLVESGMTPSQYRSTML
jgi:AraC-like DNA-binding protein